MLCMRGLALPQDKSWRVRYNVAQQVPALCEVLGADLARTELLPQV